MLRILHKNTALLIKPYTNSTLKTRPKNPHSAHHYTNFTQTTKSNNAPKPGSTSESESGSEVEEYSKKSGIRRDLMPKHVTIILDGNRRWHKQHGKALSYMPFFEANLLFAKLCLKWGIPIASTLVYGLQTCLRGEEANNLMFQHFERWLMKNLEVFTRNGVRVCIVGERSLLPESLQEIIKEVEESTKNNSKLEFMLGVCFEGRNEIAQAIKIICQDVRAGKIEPDMINESLVKEYLSTRDLENPNPDLFIRTGGDLLLSNTWLWQSAHTELYFAPIYAPDFSEEEFIKALCSFQKRERAFDK